MDHPRENPGEIDWSKLSQFGDVKRYPRTPADKLIEVIGDAEIVFTNKSPITRQVIEACPSVRFISIIATGYNTVDIEAAREHGILVSNVPSYGTGAIAQHAMALLLEITNHVAYNDSQVRLGRKGEYDGDWCFWDYPIIELENKTMGIIGLGRIGQFTARAAISFGMKVMAYDIIENADMKKIGVKYVDFDTLLTESHVITLHCPLFEDTKEIINRNTISKMRDGVKRCAMFGGAGLNSLTIPFLDKYGLPHSLRDDFIKSLDRADHEHVDVHLGNHISSNKMYEKLASREKEGGNPFIDENCWHEFLRQTKSAFEAMLKNEAGK